MLKDVLCMAKVSEIKVDPISYTGKVNLIKALTHEQVTYLRGVIEGAHPDEVVNFKYGDKHFSVGELNCLKEKKGELEIKVTAAKAKDWISQKSDNEYAGICFNAILEFLGHKSEK